MATQLSDILKLSVSERILWAEALWNSIAVEKKYSEKIEISSEHKKMLDKELLSYHKNPKAGSSWKEVKERVRRKK